MPNTHPTQQSSNASHHSNAQPNSYLHINPNNNPSHININFNDNSSNNHSNNNYSSNNYSSDSEISSNNNSNLIPNTNLQFNDCCNINYNDSIHNIYSTQTEDHATRCENNIMDSCSEQHDGLDDATVHVNMNNNNDNYNYNLNTLHPSLQNKRKRTKQVCPSTVKKPKLKDALLSDFYNPTKKTPPLTSESVPSSLPSAHPPCPNDMASSPSLNDSNPNSLPTPKRCRPRPLSQFTLNLSTLQHTFPSSPHPLLSPPSQPTDTPVVPPPHPKPTLPPTRSPATLSRSSHPTLNIPPPLSQDTKTKCISISKPNKPDTNKRPLPPTSHHTSKLRTVDSYLLLSNNKINLHESHEEITIFLSNEPIFPFYPSPHTCAAIDAFPWKTEVRQSTLVTFPMNGLFAFKSIKKNEVIAIYKGQVSLSPKDGPYMLEVINNNGDSLFIDGAANLSNNHAVMINDFIWDDNQNNAYIGDMGVIIAKANIKPNTEILLSYGPSYDWSPVIINLIPNFLDALHLAISALEVPNILPLLSPIIESLRSWNSLCRIQPIESLISSALQDLIPPPLCISGSPPYSLATLGRTGFNFSSPVNHFIIKLHSGMHVNLVFHLTWPASCPVLKPNPSRELVRLDLESLTPLLLSPADLCTLLKLLPGPSNTLLNHPT